MLDSTGSSDLFARALFSGLPAAPREAAAKVLAELRVREQSINLSSLIHRFRDCQLLEVDIEGDGYCLPAGTLGSKTLVVVPIKASEERLRFTLAHELGHLACHYSGLGDRLRDEERWCDTFAAELLMPKSRVESFASTVNALEDWLGFLAHFNVSRTAAALQLWHYRGLVVAAHQLGAKARDPICEAVRRQLTARARDMSQSSVARGELADGNPYFIRKDGGRRFVALAQL
jgi:hypothetical protein